MPSSALAFQDCVARLAEAAPALLDRALRTGGRYADLFYERSTHHQLSWKQRVRRGIVEAPKRTSEAQTIAGVGLRMFGARRTGLVATEACSRQALLAAADAVAAQIDVAGAARRAAAIAAVSLQLDLPEDVPDAVSVAEKKALLQAAAEAAFSLDADVRRVHAAYHDRVRRILVATSDGMLKATATMMLGLRVSVTLATADGSVKAHAIAGGAYGFGHFFARPPDHVAREAVERARRLVEAKPLATGTMPVVLAPGWGGVWLHEAVGHLLEGDLVAEGASPLAGHLGQRVAAPSVTLVDDATIPGGRGTQAFDDEGTPPARTVLIEDGVLRGFLTDRVAAERLGLPRTGNARRQDYRHAPLPRMTNLLLATGAADPAALVADVGDGLYVQTIGQGHVQPGHGFAFDVLEGYRIEQGRLTAPVTGVRIVGSASGILGKVVGVGRDLQVDAARGLCEKAGQVVPVSVGMPTVLISAMRVQEGTG